MFPGFGPAGLVVRLWTRHSLTTEQDLDIDEAVDLTLNLFLDAAQPHDPS